jgi:hypothetical protein
VPKCVSDTIAALRAERPVVAAQLDAIDLALDNLARAWSLGDRNVGGGGGDAETRRDQLSAVIRKADDGLTLAELRKATPEMRGKDRSNALHTLKLAKQIRRKGKKWIKVA